MIPIEYYSTIYYILSSILMLLIALPILKYIDLERYATETDAINAGMILVFTVLFIGLREPMASSVFLGDTKTYSIAYQDMAFTGDMKAKDIGFDYFMYLFANLLELPVRFFYLFCALIYVLLPYLAFKKWFKTRAWIALIVFVSSMSFWGFGINGLRNGLATSFFIYALSFKRVEMKILWIILSILFHKSMVLPAIAFMASGMVHNTSVLIRIWVITVLVSLVAGRYIESVLGSFFMELDIEDKRAQNLYVDELDGTPVSRSFRMDFILYSAIPICIGYFYVIKRKFEDVFYLRLLNTYIISNAIWVVLIYVAYSNRIAYLSWFLMPIVLVYPLLVARIVLDRSFWIWGIISGSILFSLLMFFK